jgi:hypothetical protein
MTVLSVLNGAELKGKLFQVSDQYRIELTGRADTPEARESLGVFLRAADGDLHRAGAKMVAVDFAGLTFVNSSCFKEFVVWLSTVSGRPAAEHYRMQFITNPAVRWQRASVHSLATFAADLVQIS